MISQQSLSRLDSWLDQSDLQELIVNGARSMHVIRTCGRRENYPSPYLDSVDERIELQRFAAERGLRIDPMLPAGGGEWQRNDALWRWHLVLPPIASGGVVLAIRRLNISSHNWRKVPGMTYDIMQQIELAMQLQRTIFVIGPTGSGKTTFAMSMLFELAALDRVIFLENLAEAPLLSEHWLRLVTRPPNIEGHGVVTLAQNFADVLRLRPDRIVISELRADEIDVFLQVLASGHQGTIVTTHANNPTQLWYRLMSLTPVDRHPLLRAQLESVEPLVVTLGRQQPVSILGAADLFPMGTEPKRVCQTAR